MIISSLIFYALDADVFNGYQDVYIYICAMIKSIEVARYISNKVLIQGVITAMILFNP